MTKLIDRLIYKITKKPTCYVEVKKPPQTALEKLLRPQDARQVQYNNWSKAKKVYSGSYLPKDKNLLYNKGWTPIDDIGNENHKVIQRNSTNQMIRYDNHSDKPPHAHWLEWDKKGFTKKEYRIFKNDEFSCKKVYHNKYGELVSRINPEHHIYFEESKK